MCDMVTLGLKVQNKDEEILIWKNKLKKRTVWSILSVSLIPK